MTTLKINMTIYSEDSCREFHLDFAFPDECEFWEIPPRRRDNRIVGTNAINAARMVWFCEEFAFNARRRLIRKGGKVVTRQWLTELLDRLFIFTYAGHQVDAPVLEVKLELEMRVAWELAHPGQEYR